MPNFRPDTGGQRWSRSGSLVPSRCGEGGALLSPSAQAPGCSIWSMPCVACSSSFWVFHKSANSVAPAFCAFPARAAQAVRSLGRGGTEAGAREGRRHARTRGECARQAPGCLSCSAGEGTKRRHSRVRAFVENPKTGNAGNAGPAPYTAAGSLSSVDGESSSPPSPQRDGTSEPEQETTSARLCQGGN